MQKAADRELVLLGAGHAHVEVLRRLASVRRARASMCLTLVTRDAHTPYSGLLPALLRGEVSEAEAHIDVVPLAAAAGARLVIAPAVGIDLATGQVLLAGQPPAGFDVLSLDIGGAPRDLPGVIPVKPIGGFLQRLAAVEALLPAAGAAEAPWIAVIGSGAGGTELALALAQRLRGRARTLLIGRTVEPIATAPLAARRAVAAALQAHGVATMAGAVAIRHAEGELHLADGRSIACLAALGAAGVTGPPFLAACGLACDADGCVLVGATLRSLSDPRVFAAGDCAAHAGDARPKAGVWAVRAGPPLAANLHAAAAGRPLAAWRSQRDALVILGTGNGRAVAWRGSRALSGRLPALWKGWLDRRWIARYRSRP